MLKILKIKDPSYKWKWLSERNPETDCFLVSDIKTKLSMERKLLEDKSSLPGFCVMRAYEFYKELFDSLNSKWHIASDRFVKELFSDFCFQHKVKWVQNLQNSKSFFSFFDSFLPVLLHRESPRLFQEWLQDKGKPVLWKSWIKLAQEFFLFLDSKKILHEAGRKALLFHDLPSLEKLDFKKENIYVDLSFSMDLCELEIFKSLSRYKKIFILSPQLEKSFLSDQGIDVYGILERELGLKQISSDVHLDKPGREVFVSEKKKDRIGLKSLNEPEKEKAPPCKKTFKVKSETRLEELKKAVVQIGKWLQKGIPPREIALFAPDMEAYWFALRTYLQKENIPVAKSIFAKAVDYPEVRYFLAALRIHTSSFTFEDLEYFSFFKESKKDFSYFKTCYFHVPDRDLSSKLLFQNKKLSAQKIITGSQFSDWALSFWPKEGSSFVWEKVSQIFLKIPGKESLKLSSWLKLFESEIQALERELKPEEPGGISCLSFNAFPSSRSSHVYILGLDEDSLKTAGSPFFNDLEKKEILEELGFPLAFSHPQEKANNLLWFLQSSHHQEIYLSFSSYDLKGNIQTPSLLYFLSEDLFSAETGNVGGELSWEAHRKNLDINSRDMDKFGDLKSFFPDRETAFFHKEKIQLSPSRLRTYVDCPFKYAAEKLFFVREKGLIDRELSALSKGSTAHKLFEFTLKQYPELILSEKQIEDLLEEIEPKRENFVYEQQWLLLKEDLKKILLSFLHKEKMDRENFPSLKAKAFEQELSAYWNQKTGSLDTEGDYPFIAKVDRIDKEETTGSYVVRDYKASAGSSTHVSSWIKEGKEDLQLTFYAQALQKGLISGLPAEPVLSLFYSFYKDDFSAKGFVEKGSSLESLLGENLRGPKKEREFLNQVISISNRKTQEVVQRMEEGHFAPKPRDKELCKTCAYRSWCRVETLER